MIGAWGRGEGGGRIFPFYLKPVILQRISTAWKNLLKVDFEDMVHEKAGFSYAAIYLWDRFQQFTLTAEVYDKQT